MIRSPHLLALMALSLALATGERATAQVPDGWFVTSHGWFSFAPGLGGLWLHHPRRPNQSVEVTGLPDALTGRNATGQGGASCVTRLPDGRLLVGTMARSTTVPLQMVELHFVALNGSAYNPSLSSSITIGAPGGAFRIGFVSEIQLLSSTQALICIDGIVSPPPLAGAVLATVNLLTGTVSPIPVSGLPAGGLVQAAATDGSTRCYLGLTFPNFTTRVFAVPYPNGGQVTEITAAPLAQAACAIEIDSAGRLLIAMGDLGSGDLVVLDPGTGTVVGRTPIARAQLNGFARETVTGGFGFVIGPDVHWGDGTGLATLLASPPAPGWGLPTGIDVAPDPVAYGVATGDGPRWQLAPNSGGLPLSGNAGFAVAVEPLLAGAWLLGGNHTHVPNWLGLGVDLLVSPTVSGTMNAGVIALPIPSTVPPGVSFYLQTFHVGSPLAASPGLRITTL